MRRLLLTALIPLLAACGGGADDAAQSEAFDGIAETETVYLTGTEPFWNAEISGGIAVYSTPENIDGTRFAVERFAGLNGVSFSGTLNSSRFDVTVTPGECSDAMSDRVYPFTATLMVGDEQRAGCAWTDAQPFTGPAAP